MQRTQRWDETWHRLREWTNGQAPSEHLAAQVLLADGFTELDPTHPLGGKDGGADAIARRDGKEWVMAVYFPRGQQSLKDITNKFIDDFKGVGDNGADGMVFVTNQELRRAERRTLGEVVDGEVVIYHLERVVAILDQPRMYGVRHQFLSIDIPAASQLGRGDALAEMHRKSVGRCMGRWMGAGLPRDEARALSADPATGAFLGVRQPSAQDPVVIWTAPMGSGKSIAAERFHQRGLEAASQNADAALPVFLGAAECGGSLEAAVVKATDELGQPRRVGAEIIVDGIDEVAYEVADRLLSQARVLSEQWPRTTVLLTSRPISVLTEAFEHIRFPELNEDEQLECVEIGAGGELAPTAIFGLPEPVRKTLRQPLFALLAGLWIRERGRGPRAPMDSMQILGEHATRGLTIDQSNLRRLASLSISRDLAPVPAGEAVEGVDREQLLATGLIVEEVGGVRFVLPAVAQWFAAQALMSGDVKIDQLLEAPEDLELWRYPLGLVVAMGSAEQTRQILSPLLDREAGFGLRVLDTAVGQAVLEGVPALPWRRAGEQVREALQGLADALGPTAPLVMDVDTHGRVNPIAVRTEETRLMVAFWRGAEERPDVFALPTEVGLFQPNPGWGSIRFSHVGPGAAWAWSWALDGLKRPLERMLRGRELPISVEGPLAAEEVFAAACDLLRKSTLTNDHVELDPLEAVLNEVPDEYYKQGPVVIRGSYGPSHDVRVLRERIHALREAGETVLMGPLPAADLDPQSGYIGEFFSNERLLEIGTALYEQAILGYRQLVERWLPNLLDQLEHYVLGPIQVRGFIDNGERLVESFGGPIPSLAGLIEPLPAGSTDEVTMELSDGFDFSLGNGLLERQRAARPAAARWLTGTHGGMSFEIGHDYPILDAVYRWLANDLKRLGVVGGMAHNRERGAIPPWDLDGGEGTA